LAQEKTRVLVVDDVVDNRLILARVLTGFGFSCKEVESGREALECLDEFCPDVVMTDLRMPGMSGIELIRRLRQTESTRRISIIAVSASVFEQTRREALEAGADGFLAKPYMDLELQDVLARCAGVSFSSEEEDDSYAEKEQVGTPEVSQIPEFLRRELMSAAEGGDLDGLVALARGIEDRILREAIMNRAKKYDYEGLLFLFDGGAR
jgi:CheY-like chemotaxis protein